MGRRKIEIQPITHERNRSVTFLKRKNGLFKKAYELGVLCSVDVAVIIFEERPGHQAKLYQYCSADVNGMVQRHLRFDGERDTKNPSDFNSNNKADDAADDDDDEGDDDSLQKRHDANKPVTVKTEGSSNSIVPIRPGPHIDQTASPELDYRSGLRASPTASTSSLPVSGERHTSAIMSATRSVPISSTAKRPRLGMEDSPHLPRSASAGLSNGSPTFPFRLEVDIPSSYSSVMPSLSQLHPPHPSISALYSNNMMGGPSTSFMSQSPYDLSRGQQAQTLRSVTFPHGGNASYSPHGQHHPTGVFARSPSAQASGAGGSGGNANIFAELLGSPDEHGNSSGGSTNQYAPFDWPVHAAAQASQQQGPGQHENGPPQGSTSNDNDSNWFDFLSGPGTTTAGGSTGTSNGAGISLPPPVPPLNSSRFQMGSPGMGRKRLREDGPKSDGSESDRHEVNGSRPASRKS